MLKKIIPLFEWIFPPEEYSFLEISRVIGVSVAIVIGPNRLKVIAVWTLEVQINHWKKQTISFRRMKELYHWWKFTKNSFSRRTAFHILLNYESRNIDDGNWSYLLSHRADHPAQVSLQTSAETTRRCCPCRYWRQLLSTRCSCSSRRTLTRQSYRSPSSSTVWRTIHTSSSRRRRWIPTRIATTRNCRRS